VARSLYIIAINNEVWKKLEDKDKQAFNRAAEYALMVYWRCDGIKAKRRKWSAPLNMKATQ